MFYRILASLLLFQTLLNLWQIKFCNRLTFIAVREPLQSVFKIYGDLSVK
jgi:hypothetical protein